MASNYLRRDYRGTLRCDPGNVRIDIDVELNFEGTPPIDDLQLAIKQVLQKIFDDVTAGKLDQ